MNPSLDAPGPWFAAPRFAKTALVLLAIVALVEGCFAIFLRRNDFMIHRKSGAVFLAGDPYGTGNVTYPASRLMMNAVLAVGPNLPTRAICYGLALVALYVCFRLWARLAEPQAVTPSPAARAAGLLAAGLYWAYLIRDLDECGLQILLLLMLTAAGYCLVRNRAIQAGFWLALATHYKIVPVLGLPLLLWKRQWRAAASMAIFTALGAAAPALYLGWEKTMECHRQWIAVAHEVSQTRSAYPYIPKVEPPKPQNQSLMAALARYLETYPVGHPLHSEHPWFHQFGNFEPNDAYLMVRGTLLLAGLFFAWCWRRPWRMTNIAADLPREWAVVCALLTLVAPQCWKHHLILLLPAGFLTIHHVLRQPKRDYARLACLLFTALVMLLQQDVMGRERYVVVVSYKLDTLAALWMLGSVMLLPRSAAPVGSLANPKESEWGADAPARAA